VDDYVNKHYDAVWRGRVGQFLANTDDFSSEEDWHPAKVVNAAITWLRRNRCHPRVFLWIDCFSPHQPWDPPRPFDTYTDPEYPGKRLILPMGGPAQEWATPEEIRHIRGLYAGEAAFVDHCLGRLFQELEHLGYYDDSVILLMSDHGHPLADHGKFLKGPDRMYNELLKVPFMVRLPDGRGARQTEAIIQFHDVLPTLLDLLHIKNNASSMHGRTFAGVLRGYADVHRDVVITGYHEGIDRCIRDRTWSLIERPDERRDELYNLVEDPREHNNLLHQYPEEARRLRSAFGSYFRMRSKEAVSHTQMKGVQGKYEMAGAAVR
jgi:arylsulfatase A-like enzyme